MLKFWHTYAKISSWRFCLEIANFLAILKNRLSYNVALYATYSYKMGNMPGRGRGDWYFNHLNWSLIEDASHLLYGFLFPAICRPNNTYMICVRNDCYQCNIKCIVLYRLSLGFHTLIYCRKTNLRVEIVSLCTSCKITKSAALLILMTRLIT